MLIFYKEHVDCLLHFIIVLIIKHLLTFQLFYTEPWPGGNYSTSV